MASEFEGLEDPLAIQQKLLDQTEQGLMTGDFEAFAACFAIPTIVVTAEMRREISSREALLEIFVNLRASHQAQGVTLMHRQCLRAEYIFEDEIECIHKSRVLAGETLLMSPYVVRSVLKRRQGVWRIAASEYLLETDSAFSAVLRGDAALSASSG